MLSWIQNLRRVFLFLCGHPLTSKHKLAAIGRFLRWQWHRRISRSPLVVPFVGGSQLLLRARSQGLTGFYYVGLPDFEEAAFALHLLRRGDGFADVGANAGAWTVMASMGAGAMVDAFEPVPEAASQLAENVAINKSDAIVRIHPVGVGSKAGRLRFTAGHGTGNHVVTADDCSGASGETVEVVVTTLDEIYHGRCPQLIKIDVEGWELEVLKGAHTLLRNTGLLALVVETFRHQNLSTPRLQELELLLAEHGFRPCSYHPRQRRLDNVDNAPRVSDNTIYVRNVEAVQVRLSSAPPFLAVGQRI